MALYTRLIQMLQRRDPSQTGSTLITVMMMGATLSVVSAVLITNTVFNVERSSKSVNVNGALQAAEAGIHDYIAKIADNKAYWNYWVHDAETSRDPATGTTGSNMSWTDTGAAGWTYSTTTVAGNPGAKKDRWKAVGNDFEYNLEVFPPAGSNTNLRIVSTGRAVDSNTGYRSLEAIVRPASITKIVMFVDGDLSLDDNTATTTGSIYLTDAASGTNDLCHDGTANSDLFAEDRYVTNGSCNGHGGVGIAYDGDSSTPYADLRTQIPSPITFGSLLPALDEITIAAGAAGGISRTNTGGSCPSNNYYEVTFNSNATVTIVKHWFSWLLVCISQDDSPGETIAMPTSGAIYLDKKVTMKNNSVVDGRVTLRSAGQITIDGNITYETPGDDILGLVAESDFFLQGDHTINAALFSRTGSFDDASWSTPTFNGQLILKSGAGSVFGGAGTYTWDTNLESLRPPYWPNVGDRRYELKSIREVNPTR